MQTENLSFVFFIMNFVIDRNQTIFVDSYGNVRFCHYNSKTSFPHILKMRRHQFLNFNDVIRDLSHFRHLKCIPLGQKLVFYKTKNVIELFDNKEETFFRFYGPGWNKYKSHTHKCILSFLQHGEHASHHQPHARNESQSTHPSRRSTFSLSRRKRTTSRSARNVGDDYESQREKSSTLPRWKNTNSRTHPNRRRRKHALRDLDTTENAAEDGDVSCVTSEDNEYGCEPTITIGD